MTINANLAEMGITVNFRIIPVEIRSIAGYSGSPVIVLIPGERDPDLRRALAGKGTDDAKGRLAASIIARKPSKLPQSFMLLGIDCGHLYSREPVLDDQGDPTGMTVKSNTGMAIVVGAWKLAELLDSKDVKRMREETKRQSVKRGGASFDVTTTDKPKRQGRDIEAPPLAREKFFGDLTKATKKKPS